MSTYILYSTELYHHGIKGQKWGKRRSQNKDGSLTAEGKRRYDDSPGEPKKSKHRLKLEEKYKAKGMNQAQAEEAAAKRIKTEKIIAVAAGVTVAAASAYVISKHVQERSDRIIKSGTTLQRISRDPNEDLDRPFYTAYKKGDTEKYKGLYGNQLTRWGGQAHNMKLTADADVKVVSRDKASKVFADLYKNDSEFRDAFQKSNEAMRENDPSPVRKKIKDIAAGKMTDKQLQRQGYDAFNIGLVNHDENGNKAASKFYSKLKSMGYDAVEDINDKKYSGYKAKHAVIVFNRKDKISVSDVQKMTNDQVVSNMKKVYNKQLASEAAKTGALLVGGGVALKQLDRVTTKSAVISNYKRKHPNTQMTDAQIYDMLVEQQKQNTKGR
jgi:hypothetical protein